MNNFKLKIFYISYEWCKDNDTIKIYAIFMGCISLFRTGSDLTKRIDFKEIKLFHEKQHLSFIAIINPA